MLDGHFHMKIETDMMKKFMIVCKYRERSAGSVTRELMNNWMKSELDKINKENRT